MNKEKNLHDTVYELSLSLRNGLKIKNINASTSLPPQLTSKKTQWDNFVNEMHLLRYKEHTSIEINIDSLFDESLFWLKIWP